MTSYESFDGGSHGSHQWRALGTEHSFEFVGGGPVGKDSYALGTRVDHFYIVRACELCAEVWWQEYDPVASVR